MLVATAASQNGVVHVIDTVLLPPSYALELAKTSAAHDKTSVGFMPEA